MCMGKKETSKKKFKYALIACGLIMALIANYILTLPDGKLHVYFLDVGQGDAALVRTPLNKYILIDGGPDDGVLRGMGGVLPFYVHDIELVILTHPHPDHVNGLVEVLKRYKIGTVLMTGISYDYAGYTAFLDILARNKISVIFANGSDFQFGGVTFDIIYPLSSLQGRSFENVNNSSIVFRLIYGESEFYFSGDAERPEESQILTTNVDVKADVLKVGHHGSRTASSPELVELIHPDYAVISLGADNSFKHPHSETIKTLSEDNIKILRTDFLGTIEFESDGENITRKIF